MNLYVHDNMELKYYLMVMIINKLNSYSKSLNKLNKKLFNFYNILMENLNTLVQNTSNISLSRALLIFYIIIASNFTSDLFSKQLRTFFEESRLAQHLIGFIMMLVIVILVGGINNTYRAVIYSLIGYTWFIFTTKLDIHWNIIIILIMLFGFLYESKLNEKEQSALNDPNLTEEQKNNVISTNSQYKMYIVLAILSVTIIGTIFYTNKKVEQYGGGQFDLVTYLFY